VGYSPEQKVSEVSLVRHSDAVLAIFLQLTGRETSVVSVNLVDARSRLATILGSINDLPAAGPSACRSQIRPPMTGNFNSSLRANSLIRLELPALLLPQCFQTEGLIHNQKHQRR